MTITKETTTITKPVWVVTLAYSADSIRAALINLKGAEKGPATLS